MTTNTKARGCGRKVRYDNRAAAEQHMWHLVRRGAALSTLNVYQCRHCGSHHVGHRPGQRRR